MKHTKILLVAGLTLTLLSGLLRGYIDQRWGASETMQRAAAKTTEFPKAFGAWKLVNDDGGFRELDPDSTNMLRTEASLVGRYQHRETGQQVLMIFMIGPAGPLAQHTPDVCYASMNYELIDDRRGVQIRDRDNQEHAFSVASCRERRPGGGLVRVYYSWNQQGRWRAPAIPRTAFAGVPMLYKIQVSTTDVPEENGVPDAGEQFLRDSLPALQEFCN